MHGGGNDSLEHIQHLGLDVEEQGLPVLPVIHSEKVGGGVKNRFVFGIFFL